MEDFDRRLLLGAAGLASVAALAGRAKAGPLNPPAGPVAASGKTLTDVEPRTALSAANTPGDASSVFRITAPGSYYLTANLSVPAARNGIEVAASGVTIDLSGFTVSAAAAGALAGVAADGAAVQRIVVRNGFISGMSAGVSLPSTPGVVLESLAVDACINDGIAVGDRSTAFGCVVSACGRDGFVHTDGAIFIDCAARDNGASTNGDGFTIAGSNVSAASYSNCLAQGNSGIGFHGFGSVTFGNCVSRDNGSDGYFVGQEAITAHNCIARNNGNDGFRAVAGIVESCVSMANSGSGVNLGAGTVRGCRIATNPVGIDCSSGALIVGNHIAAVAGTGISATGTGARIEGNHIVNASTGIEVVGSRNVVIGNSVRSATTAFAIAANNVYGTIVDRSAAVTAAVSGEAAVSTFGTTDPHANIAT